MARLTLDIPDDTHRKIKTLAAYFGMSMKDFLITRALPTEQAASASKTASDSANRLDDLLFTNPTFRLSPENWDEFNAALEAPANPTKNLRKLMSTPSVLDER